MSCSDLGQLYDFEQMKTMASDEYFHFYTMKEYKRGRSVAPTLGCFCKAYAETEDSDIKTMFKTTDGKEVTTCLHY